MNIECLSILFRVVKEIKSFFLCNKKQTFLRHAIVYKKSMNDQKLVQVTKLNLAEYFGVKSLFLDEKFIVEVKAGEDLCCICMSRINFNFKVKNIIEDLKQKADIFNSLENMLI